MGYVQTETRRGWGLGGSPEGDRRGLSLAEPRRHGAVVGETQGLSGARALRGADLESLSRRHGVTAAKLSAWRDEFLAGGEAHLKSRDSAERAEVGRSSGGRLAQPRRCAAVSVGFKTTESAG
jgi:hypothetical protein